MFHLAHEGVTGQSDRGGVYFSAPSLSPLSSQLVLEADGEETASRDPDLISSSYSSSANPSPPL